MSIEAAWEVMENSTFTIERYRTLALTCNYQGDTIINSLGDILCCGLGFLASRRLGFWWSVVLFLATEAMLLVWIHDSLLLNVVMLIHPVRAINAWQLGH